MKIKNIVIIASILLIGKNIVAAQFKIVNHLAKPVECQVLSGTRYKSFDGIIMPGDSQAVIRNSPLINVHNSPVTWIIWKEGNKRYKADFGLEGSSEGIKPQEGKSNFFNIYPGGKFMHNFGGFKKYDTALVDTARGFVKQ